MATVLKPNRFAAGAELGTASMSVTKQQFRAKQCKVINTHDWLIGNQYGTLDRAITPLRFFTFVPATFRSYPESSLPR